MVAKAKPSLFASLTEAKSYPVEEINPVSEPSTRNTTREDKVMVATFIPRAAHKQLRMLALQEDTELQVILVDALNGYCKDRKLGLVIPRPPKVKRGPKPRA